MSCQSSLIKAYNYKWLRAKTHWDPNYFPPISSYFLSLNSKYFFHRPIFAKRKPTFYPQNDKSIQDIASTITITIMYLTITINFKTQIQCYISLSEMKIPHISIITLIREKKLTAGRSIDFCFSCLHCFCFYRFTPLLLL